MQEQSGRDQAENALYTAVGFAVLGFQRVQYARRQLRKDLQARSPLLPPEVAADLAAVADLVDAGLSQVIELAPTPIGESAALVQSTTRHVREQLLETWVDHSATVTGSTATSTTPDPATDET